MVSRAFLTVRRAGSSSTSPMLIGAATLACGAWARRIAARMRAASSRNVKRLGHVIVGAGVQRLNLVRLVVSHAEHQDTHHRHYLANLAAGLNAIHAGHRDVQQDHIEAHRTHKRHGLISARRFGNLEAHCPQSAVKGPADGRFVIHDEQPAARRAVRGRNRRSGCRAQFRLLPAVARAPLLPCPGTGAPAPESVQPGAPGDPPAG